MNVRRPRFAFVFNTAVLAPAINLMAARISS